MWNNALRSAISLIHSECKEEKGKKYFKEKEKQKLICCQETQKAEWVAGCAFRKDKGETRSESRGTQRPYAPDNLSVGIKKKKKPEDSGLKLSIQKSF